MSTTRYSSTSLVANRSIDSTREDSSIKMSRNRRRQANGSSDEESAKEARKMFPLPVLRHGQHQPSNNTSYAAPTLENQVNRTIVVPDDFTYVSELTSPEESYPNELATTKSLTSRNLRALEAGLQQQHHPPTTQTPKTFPYHPRIDDDEGDENDLEELEANAEEFSYEGEETKSPRGKTVLLALFCLLIVVAAVAVGIGVSESQKSKINESSIVGNPTGPPIDGGIPTSAPSDQGTVPNSSDSPGGGTESPIDVPVDSPVESPTPGSTTPPTESPATSEPGPLPTLAPTSLSTIAPTIVSTVVSTPLPTTVSTPEPTQEPTAVSSPSPDPTDASTPAPTDASTPATTLAPTEGDSGSCEDQVAATESCYPLGVPITVTFTVCAPDPSGLDWIGIYRDDGTLDPSNLGEPRYWESSCVTSACQRLPYSGTLPLDVTDLREGTYQLFLVKDDSDSSPYSAFAVGNSFQVSSSC